MTDGFQHGGSLDRMRQMFPDAPQPWIDLSTGINPWPWPLSPLPDELAHRLPSASAFDAARRAMAAAYGAPTESVLPGPGSEILIRLLPTLIKPRKIALLSPTYGDHKTAWQAQSYPVIESENPLDLAGDADAVVLCNPNNPDGRIFEPAALDAAREELAARGGWLIIDEAYADLAPAQSMASFGGAAGLIVLRSMGKFYGLAGLRVGAMIAPPEILDRLAALLGVWSLSGPALEIAAGAFADKQWQVATLTRLCKARQKLDVILHKKNCKIVGGTNLFAFIENELAHDRWALLAHEGVYVRRFQWSDQHLRIGLPPHQDAADRLAAALSLSA